MNDTRPRLAAYYFPGFHADPRTDRLHGPGWTEWELVRAARPRFPGHDQPRVSAWGEFDESDPAWGLRQAQVAAEHGLDALLFDWYWYDGDDFLNAALDRGFLGNPELPIEFALMWANHDWLDIHPNASASPAQRLFAGPIGNGEFDALAETVVGRYFSRPEYLRLDGAPYFSIYEAETFVSGFGSVGEAGEAVDRLRAVARAVGHPGIHLNLVVSDRAVTPGERVSSRIGELASALRADSLTSYVWIHHHDPGLDGFPVGSYANAAAANRRVWEDLRSSSAIPYFPNVTVSWDSSPRALQTDVFRELGYPWMATMEGTPAEFEAALGDALAFVDSTRNGLVTVNAWNEWTEGSYLLPDRTHGDARLRAVAAAVARHRDTARR